MNPDSNNVRAIFLRAVETCEPGDWSGFLDDACDGDAKLRRRVEILLEAHLGDDSLFDEPNGGIAPTIDQSVTEQAGTQIGPYKLLQKLGEGGMGVVYMAEQSEPVKRRVALKIIKPGMDTGQVIARFEAERQALALMDHPGIAKVIDAGATESGRPFFAMELVKGIPITQYCDENHLTPKQRLELFVQVCQAVQHAHQKGIIHRDLKPSNVLVAEYDQKAVPKIIDFGVAKATSQQLTEKTMFTQYGQIVGTLEYMSPEQAKLNQLDIDTRSDVYSLGVLLYELLVGATPFDRKRLQSAAFEEMLRIIREEEPPRPSIRLSTIGTLRAIAAQRKTEPKRLSTLVRGELDWIVMKALEKDRARRYETANGFAADIQRYLDDEAVVACPPSAGYRFRKFAKRHRASLATATGIGVTLLVATVISIWLAGVANEQRNIANKQRNIANEQRNIANEQSEIAKKERNAVRKERDNAQELLKELVFLAILAGDEEKAQDAINKAERVGVPAKLITLFRGQLALYYGRIEDAIEELEQVTDESIAALAMVSYAYAQAMEFEKTDFVTAELMDRLVRDRDLMTSEDKLFAGQAMVNRDMILGLELVEEARREYGSSPLADMIYAEVLSAYAHNTGHTTKLTPAFQAIKSGMRWVGDVPAMVSVHTMVRSVAYVMGMNTQMGIDMQELHTDWDVVNSLPMGRVMLIRPLASLGDPKVPEYIESITSMTEGEMIYYIPILLHYWPAEKVLAFVEERRDKLNLYGRCARARLMALLPNRRADAERLCEKIARESTLFEARAICLNTLLLLGKDDKVRRLARDLYGSSTASAVYGKEIVRFLADRGSTLAFLEAAGEVYVVQLEALFTVAMLHLATGKRAAALDNLQKSIDTTAGQWHDYWWARVFIEYIEDDVTWPAVHASDNCEADI